VARYPGTLDQLVSDREFLSPRGLHANDFGLLLAMACGPLLFLAGGEIVFRGRQPGLALLALGGVGLSQQTPGHGVLALGDRGVFELVDGLVEVLGVLCADQGVGQVDPQQGGVRLQPHRLAVGAETLALRMERSCGNAMRLAQWLQAQPGVARVAYPGLPSHPQHARAAALFRHFGGLLSFELRDGIDCFDFLDALQVVIKSSHLGDNRTLSIPVSHTIFFEMGAAQRARMGIAESLIRLSVGIEDYDDLQADFAQALARVGV
jgi:hypothetical protein